MQTHKKPQSVGGSNAANPVSQPAEPLLSQVTVASLPIATATELAAEAVALLGEILGNLSARPLNGMSGFARGQLVGKLKKAIKALRQSIRHGDDASLALEVLAGMIEGLDEERAPGGRSRPLALRTEFQRVDFKGKLIERGRVHFKFAFDEAERSFPEASGKLLVALIADRGAVPDDFVGFKSMSDLEKELCQAEGTIRTQLTRLANKLEEAGLSSELLQKSLAGNGWRIRVRRPRHRTPAAGCM